MRQKSRARNTRAIGRPVLPLHDPITTRASQLGPNLADHFKANRFDFQHLRNIFAEMFQLTRRSQGKLLLRRVVVLPVAGARQRAAYRFGYGSPLCSLPASQPSLIVRCSASSRTPLLDLTVQLLRRTPTALRRSLAISSFNCSISLSRHTISSCCETISALVRWDSSASRSEASRAQQSLARSYAMNKILGKSILNKFVLHRICGS